VSFLFLLLSELWSVSVTCPAAATHDSKWHWHLTALEQKPAKPLTMTGKMTCRLQLTVTVWLTGDSGEHRLASTKRLVVTSDSIHRQQRKPRTMNRIGWYRRQQPIVSEQSPGLILRGVHPPRAMNQNFPPVLSFSLPPIPYRPIFPPLYKKLTWGNSFPPYFFNESSRFMVTMEWTPLLILIDWWQISQVCNCRNDCRPSNNRCPLPLTILWGGGNGAPSNRKSWFRHWKCDSKN